MKRILSVILVSVLLLGTAAAVSAADYGTRKDCAGCSPWAEEELVEAADAGFIPQDLAGSWQSGITRREFAEAAVYFLAVQFTAEPEKVLAKADSGKPFTDTDDPCVVAAEAYGVLEGRGSGIFDPDALITREEAAKILLRACLAAAKDPVLPTGSALRFSDAGEISDRAAESVAILDEWGVMKGVSATAFAPKGTYTREQCFLTFLRLWKNAPYSVLRGNTRSLEIHARILDHVRENWTCLPVGDKTARYIELDLGADDLAHIGSADLNRYENGKTWLLESFIGENWTGGEVLALFGIGKGDLVSLAVDARNTPENENRLITDPAALNLFADAVAASEILPRERWAEKFGWDEAEDMAQGWLLTVTGKYGTVVQFRFHPVTGCMILSGETFLQLPQDQTGPLAAIFRAEG